MGRIEEEPAPLLYTFLYQRKRRVWIDEDLSEAGDEGPVLLVTVDRELCLLVSFRRCC